MAHELGKPEAAVPVPATEDGPFAGFVFKVVADPYVGRLSYVRVLRGSLAAADHAIWIARQKKAEKIGGLLSVQGKETAPLERASAGDIIAISKVESLNYCDTVCVEATPVEFPRIELPKPMYMVAVTPKARGDEQKIGGALEKLHAEDPTFMIHRDAETAELVVHGMSSLHLDIMFHKLQRRYHVGVDAHPPRIPYRETVIGKAEGHHRHKKQTGGRGQFGEVYLRVYPLERGSGFQYVDSVVGGSIPRQFIPEVEKGIRQALSKGIIAGYPVVDVAAEVYDGKYHDVDSDQISFQIAGGRAFAEGFDKAKPILLEPIMQLDIMIPMRFTGDITGSLNSIRGRLTGMETVGDFQVIRAQVPLKEVMDYSTQLRSITAGEGTFTMEFGHYDPVPAHLQAEIVAKLKRHVEE
jgi:elongation factor G